jgi:hypothetical protein
MWNKNASFSLLLVKIGIITRNCEISDILKALILHYNIFMVLLGKNMATMESDKLFYMFTSSFFVQNFTFPICGENGMKIYYFYTMWIHIQFICICCHDMMHFIFIYNVLWLWIC